jgi:hypothetical protein
MKKLLFIAMLAVTVVTLHSCNKDKDDDTTTTGTTSTTSTTGNPIVNDGITLTSEGSLTIKVNHTFGNTPLQMSPANYVTEAQDTVKVTQLTYYISNVTLTTAAGSQVDLGNYNLMEFTPNASSDFTLTNVPAGNYTSVSFTIGVDSLANSTGSHTGDLDPSNGMYWTWNTGYVFIRLKGRYSDNKSYSFDIGGDGHQMNVSHNLTSYKVSGTSVTTSLTFDLKKVFHSATTYDLKTDDVEIHTSSAEGIAKLRPNISAAFSITGVQ